MIWGRGIVVVRQRVAAFGLSTCGERAAAQINLCAVPTAGNAADRNMTEM